MTKEETVRIPHWFRIVSIFAVLWNLLGVMSFAAQLAMDDATIADLPDRQREVLQALPTWAVVAFGVAVICGAAGSMLLALRNRASVVVLWLSLIGVLVQNTHNFFLSDALEVYGAQAVVLPVVVIVIAIGLAILSLRAKRDGWLAD
ncbi:MAG: hypothetical protein ABJZ55_17255 [Fuerstiella sp.]